MFESLENLRKKLLDLSNRNLLLNFSHARRGGHLRLLNISPDQFYKRLIIEEEEIRFSYIPNPKKEQLLEAGYIEIDEETGEEKKIKEKPTAVEWANWLEIEKKIKEKPTAVEWANWLEIESNFELPYKDSESKEAKTLYFPIELESRLRTLHNKAEAAMQETGRNIFYLAIGFLEWIEDKTVSKNFHLAPLYLIPVKLNKGKLDKKSGTYIYTFNYTGEDILPNLSLKEKLRIDFNLALPDLDDSVYPEKYFEEINGFLKDRFSLWKVQRYATLAFLNFGKLLMYLDLDENNWPKENSPISHPIINHFFGTNQKESNFEDTIAEEYNIDEIENVNFKYPLIEDADASQHSAVIDALNGKNLVIQGPPGTGKSQTITNLIAVSLSEGKKVLFIAEKLAALEVVKERLDRAGLGDFCLELHSHKTQKRKVLDDIEKLLSKRDQYQVPSSIKSDTKSYEHLRKQLKDYNTLIHKVWKNTEKSIHKILMLATRYRLELNLNPKDLSPKKIDGYTLTPDFEQENLDSIRNFVESYKMVIEDLKDRTNLKEHPWCGITNTSIQPFNFEEIFNALKKSQKNLEDSQKIIFQLEDLLNINRGTLQKIDTIYKILKDIELLIAKIPENTDFYSLSFLLQQDKFEIFQNCLEEFKKNKYAFDEIFEFIKSYVVENFFQLNMEDFFDMYHILNISPEINFNILKKELENINKLQENLKSLKIYIKEITLVLGSEFDKNINLNENGLFEFSVFIKLIAKLKKEVLWKNRHECFKNNDLDDILLKIQQKIHSLKILQEPLSKHFNLKHIPSSEELKIIQKKLNILWPFCWFDKDWREARVALLSIAQNPTKKFKKIIIHLPSLINYMKEKEIFENYKNFHDLLDKYFVGIETPIEELISLRNWYKEVKKTYTQGFKKRINLEDLIFNMPTSIVENFFLLIDQGIEKQTNEALLCYEGLSKFFGSEKDSSPLKNDFLSLLDGSLDQFQQDLKKVLDYYSQFFYIDSLSFIEISKIVSKLINFKNFIIQFQKSDIREWFHKELDIEKKFLNQKDNFTLMKLFENIEIVVRFIIKDLDNDILKSALHSKIKEFFEFTKNLENLKNKLDSNFKEYKNQFQEFEKIVKLKEKDWFFHNQEEISTILSRNNMALENENLLDHWLDYIKNYNNLIELGFKNLLKKMEDSNLLDKLELGYYLAVNDLLAREIFDEEFKFTTFSSDIQTTTKEKFCKADKEMKLNHRKYIAYKIAQHELPEGNRGERVSEYTEMYLLRHEINKKTRHIPIRQIIDRAGQALTKLKPCFMMSPISVAQYLKPGKIEFDLVIMDEASQIKPENALGSIARGKQLIVVGDTKQLPPTNFFEKIVSSEDENKENRLAVEEYESILAASLPIFKMRHLRWHYRSRHESLIVFSNQHFYENKLIVFPSPYSYSDEYGIKFTRVKNGCFRDRYNSEEAKELIKNVENHLIFNSKESLGIVTMNQEQRDYIESEIEKLSKEKPKFQEALEQNKKNHESLFIKNLENVQGDERDVIFISFTYGPEEIAAKVAQRFGPINQDSGWRRLNVLFTRSKKRMHIFSSMDSKDITVSENSSRGVKALKDFLIFVENAIFNKPSNNLKSYDNDFAIAVFLVFNKSKFEVVSHVGCSECFIDIAIQDPRKIGRYLMGIESEKNNGYLSKSVHDRERLHQEVLEKLGWKIKKIYALDCYRNLENILSPIIRELENIQIEIKNNVPIEETNKKISNSNYKKNALEISIIEPIAALELMEPLDNLRNTLLYFDNETIRKKLPNTPEENRLLSPKMLEFFIKFKPTSKQEFQKFIPYDIRDKVSSEEGQYLEQILKIINITIKNK